MITKIKSAIPYYFFAIIGSILIFFSIVIMGYLLDRSNYGFYVFYYIVSSALVYIYEPGVNAFILNHKVKNRKLKVILYKYILRHSGVYICILYAFAFLAWLFRGDANFENLDDVGLFLSFALIPLIVYLRWVLNAQKIMFIVSNRANEYSFYYAIGTFSRFVPSLLVAYLFSIEAVLFYHLIIIAFEVSFIDTKYSEGPSFYGLLLDSIKKFGKIRKKFKRHFVIGKYTAVSMSYFFVSQLDKLAIYMTSPDYTVITYFNGFLLLSIFLYFSSLANDLFKRGVAFGGHEVSTYKSADVALYKIIVFYMLVVPSLLLLSIYISMYFSFFLEIREFLLPSLQSIIFITVGSIYFMLIGHLITYFNRFGFSSYLVFGFCSIIFFYSIGLADFAFSRNFEGISFLYLFANFLTYYYFFVNFFIRQYTYPARSFIFAGVISLFPLLIGIVLLYYNPLGINGVFIF